ncbi:MAG: tetratricopeptide repeat protein [Tepidisphaera sp.]|nr:tetratricopeptide repeat protein [Tepidisphaera sp.]
MTGVRLDQIRELVSQGKNEQAKVACRRLVQSAPADAAAASLMALILMNLGEVPQAIFYAQKAAGLSPQDFRARMNLAGLLATERRFDEAMKEIDAATRLEPGSGETHQLATLCLLEQGKHAAARERCAAGLKAAPEDHDLLVTRANTLLDCGDAAGALAALDGLAAKYPDDAFVLSTRALVMNYVDGVEPGRVRAAHEAYGALASRGAPDLTPRGARTPGRLRVGFVSPDLRGHSVAMFMLPLLRHLSRGEFQTFAYFTNRFEDETTRVCRGLVEVWRECGNVSDAALAGLIARDELDVCVELSGHTKGHSLGAMAAHPARVVATYLGYPNTTGVRGVDVRIVDSRTDPVGEADGHATERLVRLDPCFVCFEPPMEAPEVRARDAGRAPTFVSFNAAPKLSPRVLGLWAKVMESVPGSRLVLKAAHFSEAALREEVLGRLAAAGVARERVEVLSPTKGRAEHLAAYHAGDVALDTYPYHGTTTTLEAMWMGVPVVTLAGGVHASRVGVSLLQAVGLQELVAKREEEYVEIAAGLVMDAERLAGLRGGLRERVRASVLCDGAGFAARFGRMLRAIAEEGVKR